MAKLWILSDLHREVRENLAFDIARPDADILIAAGDILESDVKGALEYVDQIRGPMEAIFVSGNHEHWGLAIEDVAEQGREAAARLGIHYLDDSFTDIAGLTFGGGTHWHQATQPGGSERPDLLKIMTGAQPAFGLAREPSAPYEEPVHVRGPDVMDRRAKNLTIDSKHQAAIRALGSQYADVIVTHYPPTMASLSAVPNAGLWIHGHLHERIRGRHGDTKIICNPRGSYRLVFDFEPGLVVEASRFGGR